MKFQGLDIAVKKSQRKTVSIFVERDGSVTARVPADLGDEDLHKVLKKKEYLLFQKLSQWRLLNDSRKEREMVSGQSFPYLGRNYTLKLVDEGFKGLRFKNNRFELSRRQANKGRDAFKEFYKTKLEEKLPAIVKRYASKLGVQPESIRVMELMNRWASCSSKRNLNFNWKCAMAPLDVIHYIVAHELTHLVHANHTPAFWNELDKLYPDYQHHVEWLRQNGAGMDL